MSCFYFYEDESAILDGDNIQFPTQEAPVSVPDKVELIREVTRSSASPGSPIVVGGQSRKITSQSICKYSLSTTEGHSVYRAGAEGNGGPGVAQLRGRACCRTRNRGHQQMWPFFSCSVPTGSVRYCSRQKALSILAELRAYVEGGEGEVAADLDGFDDGISQNASAHDLARPRRPGRLRRARPPALGQRARAAASGAGTAASRSGTSPASTRATCASAPSACSGTRRAATCPGEAMAEVSSVVRTIGDAYPTTQVYDVYLLALENVPGWWVYMDAIQPFIEATLDRPRGAQPGPRVPHALDHDVRRSAATSSTRPYTNETRDSTDATRRGRTSTRARCRTGSAAARYYPAERMPRAREPRRRVRAAPS